MPYLPSIFDSQELRNQLVELVRPQVKQAQTAPAVADPNQVKAVAAKMANNLSTATSVNVDATGDPLYMRDLQNLDQFITFLRLGRVNYAGHPIVNDQYSQMTPEEQTHYVPYKLNQTRY